MGRSVATDKWGSAAPSIRWTAGGIYLVLSVIVVFAVHSEAVRVGLDDLSRTGKLRVDQVSERLTEQLDHYRALVNYLSTDQRVVSAVADLDARAEIASFPFAPRPCGMGQEESGCWTAAVTSLRMRLQG